MRKLLAAEAAMWRNLFLWLRRRPVELGEGDRAFGYLGGVKMILIFFICFSAFEIPLFDVIVAHVVPWRPARWIVLGLGAWGLLWMIGLYAGLKLHPHVVTRAALRVRLSNGVDVTLPWESIASVTKRVRPLASGKSVQELDGALHVVVNSQTNVDVRLHEVETLVTGKAPTAELRLYADDADGLVTEARSRLAALAETGSPARARPAA